MAAEYDVIIIGGGLSGLAAGIRLAHYGKRVAIFEQHSVPGGLNSYYRRKGQWIDAGLHAMTNFTDETDKRAPFNRLLRQLRLRRHMFDMVPQRVSRIEFPEAVLEFSNDISDLKHAVGSQFPECAAGFDALTDEVAHRDAVDLDAVASSAREALHRYVGDSPLIDMLFCPLMFYGNADEHDMEFNQFCIMFKSIFLEGMWRPRDGMRPFVTTLLERFCACGGEFEAGRRVARLVKNADGSVIAVAADGSRVTADRVLSSIGYLETLQLLDSDITDGVTARPGKLGYVETIFTLDRPPSELGFDATITFFNRQQSFEYSCPQLPVDYRSGVMCIPGNFVDGSTCNGARQVRLTHLANPEFWLHCSDAAYLDQKRDVVRHQLAELDNRFPGVAGAVIDTDMFTPKTIRRYTGHLNGSIYGTPDKVRRGETPLPGVFVCGTDQGFLGIVGSMLSGISIANLHLLR